MATMASARFRLFCWASLAFVIAVIIWGAYVRASGSGAGCGSHWPMCNGEVVPRSPSVETVIELTHRITSGLSAIFLGIQVVWTWRLFGKGHVARKAAAWAAVFMLGEVLVGGAIVLLEYVHLDDSIGRAVIMPIHLVNTFLLVGAMTLLAHYAGGNPGWRLRGRGWVGAMAAVAILAVILAGATGAIAALGDTLFPADSLRQGIARDFSPTAHFLEQLRPLHPFVALGAALLLLALRQVIVARSDSPRVAAHGTFLRVAVLSQVLFGFANMMMLAPIWMQMVHLLIADLVWIALVLFVAVALAEPKAIERGTEDGVARAAA